MVTMHAAYSQLRSPWSGLEFRQVRRVTEEPSFIGYAEEVAGDGALARFTAGAHERLDLKYFTLNWPNNPTVPSSPPNVGDLICGELTSTASEPYFRRWFVCDEQLMRLVFELRQERPLTTSALDELRDDDGRVTPYWVLACLFIADDVSSVMYQTASPVVYLPDDRQRFFPSEAGSSYIEDWVPRMVHLLSHWFRTDWWGRFCELAMRADTQHWHDEDGTCYACQVQLQRDSSFTGHRRPVNPARA